jgi:hypothetical protein
MENEVSQVVRKHLNTRGFYVEFAANGSVVVRTDHDSAVFTPGVAMAPYYEHHCSISTYETAYALKLLLHALELFPDEDGD